MKQTTAFQTSAPDEMVSKASGQAWQNILHPLLIELQWVQNTRQLQEALPPAHVRFDGQELRAVLARLGFKSFLRHGNPQTLDNRWLPAIWVDDNDIPHLILQPEDCAEAPADAILILFESGKTQPRSEVEGTLRYTFLRYAPILQHVLLLSLLVGVLVLAPVFYNLSIYDHIIASGSTKGLNMLAAGALLALAAEVGMRYLRNRRLGYFGARIDHYISCSVFERLLFLPPHYTERASVSAQLARLKDFESVREFFTGPLSSLFFEMPLILIYLIAMIVVGKWLGLIPVVLLGGYALLIWGMNARLQENSREAARTSSQRQEFLLETVTKLPAIRLAGMEEAWQERYRQLSNTASLASFRSGFSAQVLEIGSYTLMMLGAIATLGFGVHAVIHQSITVGALIASVMLMWRIVTPMQICCASMTRLRQLSASSTQVHKLLSLTPEHDPYTPPAPLPEVMGHISFHRVSLRYSPDMEPALLGVSFDVKPGQITAIRGNNGSGKSTILKLMLGLYLPQNGSVRLDGVDIRQIDPLVLRQSISYVPQHTDLFPGTIHDNLLFANPDVSEEDCIQALENACAREMVESLPKGLNTIITAENTDIIPFLLRQRINLARAYLRPSRIMLFDEATHALGKENDEAFTRIINSLRGKCSILLVTHREDHMRMANQLLVLDKGELTHAGPPDAVIKSLQGKPLQEKKP